MSQLDLKIGPKIKAFRRQLGLQANKLAEDLNISRSYLNLIDSYFLLVNFVNLFLQDFSIVYNSFILFNRFCKFCKL